MQTIYSGGGAQTVEVYAQDSAGRPARPSSATLKIVDLLVAEDDDDRVILDTAAATVDTVSTTTTTYAGRSAADPRLVVVTSAAGVTVGAQYLLTSGSSSEAVLVDRVSSLNVYVRDPIRGAYSIGATFVGLRVSGSFPADTANDADQLARDPAPYFGVDWIFVGVDGPLRVRTLASIERRGVAARATVADMFEADPQLAASTHNHTKLETHLKRADRELTALLLHRGARPSDTDEGDVGRLAVSWRAVELAYGVLENHTERREWAGVQAQRWTKMLLDGHKRADAVETPRTTDRVRITRPRVGVTDIRGDS